MVTKLLVIVGPTGVGKSALAMRLAREFGGEIIGADSRQVYRYMSIGTAKPPDADRAEIPHHLVDIIKPDERYSLALFLREHKVLPYITQKRTRGKLPMVVGGTGQYVWGLLEGWQVPQVNPNAKLREELESRVDAEGCGRAVRGTSASGRRMRLKRVDGRNPRRVVRALEVALSGGMDAPGGGDVERPRKVPPDYDAMVVGLTMERAALYARIDERVDAQMAAGWLDEVRRLRELGYGLADSERGTAALSGPWVWGADAAPGRGDGAGGGGAANQVPDAQVRAAAVQLVPAGR